MVHKLRSRDLTYVWETDYHPWLLRVTGNDRKKDSNRFIFYFIHKLHEFKKYISS